VRSPLAPTEPSARHLAEQFHADSGKSFAQRDQPGRDHSAGLCWLEKLAQAAAVKGVEMTRQLGDQLRLDGHRAGIAKAGGDAIDGSFFAK
jgi:hypothetical protein